MITPPDEPFLSIAEMRRLLGDEAAGKSDAQIAEMRADAYEIAAVIIAAYQAAQVRPLAAAGGGRALWPAGSAEPVGAGR